MLKKNWDMNNLQKTIRRVLREESTKKDEYQRKWRIFEMFMKRRGKEIEDLIKKYCDEYRDELNTVLPKFVILAVKDEVVESLIVSNNIGDEQVREWVAFYIDDNYTHYVEQQLFSDKEEMRESELTEKCWKGYTQKGMKTMFGKKYPNCVKKKK